MPSVKSNLKRLSGLLLLSLSLFVTGCAVTTRSPLKPPSELMADCLTPPSREAQTNIDLLWLIQDLRLSLALCNADKAGLRAWAGGEP